MTCTRRRAPTETVPGAAPVGTPDGGVSMDWVKPDFEVLELGMEVTAYVYTA